MKRLIIACISLLLSLFICDFSCASYSVNPRTWGSAEYLYWWVQDSQIKVPLVTQNGNPAALGLINEAGTEIIFGSGAHKNAFIFNGLNGGRVTIGGWIDENKQYGVEGSGFGFPQTKNTFTASSVNGRIPVINIPFFSTQPTPISALPSEDVLVFHHPNTVLISDTFKTWGIDLNTLYHLCNQVNFPFIFLVGIRYISISENLNLNDAVIGITTLPMNSVLNVNDDFSTRNNFYGLQIGARNNLVFNKFIFDINATLALGNNYQKLRISGQTNINHRTLLQPIGIFTEPSNIGHFQRNQFAIMPEIKLKLGYQLSKNIIPFITYNCLYINKIIRPGKEIDRNINLTQNSFVGGTGVLSGVIAPKVSFNNTGMWMQGLGAGIQIDI